MPRENMEAKGVIRVTVDFERPLYIEMRKFLLDRMGKEGRKVGIAEYVRELITEDLQKKKKKTAGA
jgi:hypothetical protein